MGTRADFYVRKDGGEMEWLGSIAWDGYSAGKVESATSERVYRSRLKKFLSERKDATYPSEGWPWPWNNSKLTDCIWVWDVESYSIWIKHEIVGSYEDHTKPVIFTKGPHQRGYNEDGEEVEVDPELMVKWLVPDMANLKNVKPAGSEGSGVMVFKSTGP